MYVDSKGRSVIGAGCNDLVALAESCSIYCSAHLIGANTLSHPKMRE
jgi:hypothetical protein